MPVITSSFTKVASTILIVVGFLSFTSSLESIRENQGSLEGILYIFVLIWGVLAFVAGSYLLKKKRWAFILALVLLLFIVAIHTILFFTNGLANILNFVLIGLSLILLIAGRKDFKKTT